MTGRWFTRTAVATRLRKTLTEIEDLICSGALHLECIAGDHDAISEASVQQYEREHAGKPSVGGGPELPADIEDEYQRLKDAP